MRNYILLFFTSLHFVGHLGLAEESASEFKKYKFEAYGAFSRTIVNSVPFQYNSYLIDITPSFESKGYWSLGVERFVFAGPKSKTSVEKWNARASYQYGVFKGLTVSTSLLRLGIDGKSNDWLGTLGVKGFQKLQEANPNLISEVGFYGFLDHEGFGSLSGFGRVGWSLGLDSRPDQMHFKVEPLVAELKAYTTNNEKIYGYHFGVLSVGPRLRLANSSDTLGASLYVTQTRNVIKGYSHTIAKEWATLSLDIAF